MMNADRVKSFCAPLAAALVATAAWTRAAADSLQLLWWDVWPSEVTVFDEDGTTPLAKTVHDDDTATVTVDGTPYVLNGARVRAIDPSSGDYTYLQMPAGASGAGGTVSVIDVPRSWYADVTGYASGSPEFLFSIEIGNWDADSATWTGVALSTPTSYTDLGNYITDWVPGSTSPAGSTFWAPEAYTVPEPTSGLLLALGAALMALRRRRAEA